ncbi:hypothetical protein RMR16_012910 [Agrobacterium sp. rho-13.3]|jgi:hypothetical protein|uniref:hypothetical protein n=1 Tax=Agrobacterium sp. rho-13.3 TaxID=3072980 RepID=UPI002A118008|nr:hypothetical protein [Agrobacterium sp. rho-13.3]MDX8310667.1 hypothetical protein [Agrobacterium sp. rho-13.3]
MRKELENRLRAVATIISENAAQKIDCCIAQNICQMALFKHKLEIGKSKNT